MSALKYLKELVAHCKASHDQVMVGNVFCWQMGSDISSLMTKESIKSAPMYELEAPGYKRLPVASPC